MLCILCFHNPPNSNMDHMIFNVRTFLCVRVNTDALSEPIEGNTLPNNHRCFIRWYLDDQGHSSNVGSMFECYSQREKVYMLECAP